MTLFAPHIKTPEGAEAFNLSTVAITWDNNDPPSTDSDVTTDSTTHEIEYTDNYAGSETNWYTLKKRIPWSQESFTWNVGKMIKSTSVRIRMRARSTFDESLSDWSISSQFSINIFDLIAPAIVNPLPSLLYTDFILIILDESLTKDTYHQKVRYTLEYSSQKRSIDWSIIVSEIPVGQNVVRWNIEALPASDDYIIRLTAKNASCFQTVATESDQFARQFVRDIQIRQSGLFLIDTKPPEAILEIENSSRVTNVREQVVNIFAEDSTSDIDNIQIRECNAETSLALGDLEDPEGGTVCTPISELLEGEPNFGMLIGKPINNSAKIEWVFDNISGLRKIEALLTDIGGNSSIQEMSNVFVPAFSFTDIITDFIIVIEQRDNVTIDETTTPPSVVIEPSLFEVVYLSTITGQFWVLEPFAKFLYTLSGLQILQIIKFNANIYLFTYNPVTDSGQIYRHDITSATLINTFPNALSITEDVVIFNDSLFIGFQNGELWQYDGLQFTNLTALLPVSQPINTLFGDDVFLYIGFQNSTSLVLYNGTQFFTSDLES